MKTYLVSGADTDVGKTFVAAALARAFARRANTVQIVKPYQSGVARPETEGDAALACARAHMPNVSAHTLRAFRAPLGPLCAAEAESCAPEVPRVLHELAALPVCDVRLIEGAGGLAVPLAHDGYDWADFASDAGVDAAFLVVADRLGAICQARMLRAYAFGKGLRGGILLNALAPCPRDVARSTRARLGECGVEIWGELAWNAADIEHFDAEAFL